LKRELNTSMHIELATIGKLPETEKNVFYKINFYNEYSKLVNLTAPYLLRPESLEIGQTFQHRILGRY